MSRELTLTNHELIDALMQAYYAGINEAIAAIGERPCRGFLQNAPSVNWRDLDVIPNEYGSIDVAMKLAS